MAVASQANGETQDFLPAFEISLGCLQSRDLEAGSKISVPKADTATLARVPACTTPFRNSPLGPTKIFRCPTRSRDLDGEYSPRDASAAPDFFSNRDRSDPPQRYFRQLGALIIGGSLMLAAVGSEASAGPPGPPPGVTYSGRAVVVTLRVESEIFRISDTGEVPSTGQPQEVYQPVWLDSYFRSSTLYGRTAGRDYTVLTEASLEKLDINLGGNSVQADAVRSQAQATCSAPGTLRLGKR